MWSRALFPSASCVEIEYQSTEISDWSELYDDNAGHLFTISKNEHLFSFISLGSSRKSLCMYKSVRELGVSTTIKGTNKEPLYIQVSERTGCLGHC